MLIRRVIIYGNVDFIYIGNLVFPTNHKWHITNIEENALIDNGYNFKSA